MRSQCAELIAGTTLHTPASPSLLERLVLPTWHAQWVLKVPASGTFPASPSPDLLRALEPGELTRGEAAFLFAVEVSIGGHDYGDNGNLGRRGKAREVSASVLGGREGGLDADERTSSHHLGLDCKVEGATFEGQHRTVVVSRSFRKNPDSHLRDRGGSEAAMRTQH